MIFLSIVAGFIAGLWFSYWLFDVAELEHLITDQQREIKRLRECHEDAL